MGHVLDKVDGKDPVRKRISTEFFQQWRGDPEHEIFTKFIERELNNLLKEYASDTHPLKDVSIVTHFILYPWVGVSLLSWLT